MGDYCLRRAGMADLDTAVRLIDEAKAYLKAQGVDQWQAGYPDRKCIGEDIRAERGYILTDGAADMAYLCIDFDGEPAYAKLDGQWLSDLNYAVVHRLAVSDAYKGRGLASVAFRLAQELCQARGVYSLRVDTDKDNGIMRHLLAKNGFSYCGTVWFQNSTKYAYEKLLTR